MTFDELSLYFVTYLKISEFKYQTNCLCDFFNLLYSRTSKMLGDKIIPINVNGSDNRDSINISYVVSIIRADG